MAKKLYEFPFVRGQDEGIDQRLLTELAPKGTLARAVNVRLRRDGRLGTRHDYETLSAVANSGTLDAHDLTSFQGRLVALGDTQSRGYPADVYEYVGAGAKPWIGTDSGGEIRIGGATQMRDLGRLPQGEGETNYLDVAATGGVMCIVSSNASASYVHVVMAENDQRILVERSTTLLRQPRVVAIGGVFYIAGLTSAGTSITLRKFNPASDTATVAVATPFAVGDAITAWDMTADTAGAKLVMAAARSTPTSSLLIVTTAGVTETTIAGPAEAENFVTCWSDGTRAHLITVPTATELAQIRTYIIATTTLENGPTTLFSSNTVPQQVGIVQRNATTLRVVGEIDITVSAATVTDVATHDVTVSTHALASFVRPWRTSHLTTKPKAVLESGSNFGAMVGVRFTDDDTTSALALLPDTPLAAVDHFIAGADLRSLPHIATDSSTGLVYWPRLTADADGDGTPVAAEFAFRTAGRMQMAALGGHLYIAGGVVSTYDTRQVVESGFLDVPVISTIAATNGSGSLTPNSTYSVAVVWEHTDAQGDMHQSSPSAVSQVTLGASDDTVNIQFIAPRSKRIDATNQQFGQSVKGGIYLSTANGTVLHRERSITIEGGILGRQIIPAGLGGPDATLAEQAVIYTQGSRGALSGPLPFETALPSRYVWASKERLLLGGQLVTSQVQESRPLFPGEPIGWSLDLGFFTRVRGRVTAVAILDEQRIVFTDTEVFIVPGDGLDDNGLGEFGPGLKLPSETGCIDWRSVVEVGDGLLFQGDTDKIYLLPRGGGKPVWIGQPIRDTLAAFPVITSASYLVAEQCAYFTCMNTGGTSGTILVFDTRAQTWYVDEPVTAEGYRAGCAHDGQHHMVLSTGLVRRQRAAGSYGSFVPVTLETGDIYAGGPDGWAQYYGCSAQLEFEGNFTITLAYSLDAGKTYTSGTTYTVSGLTVGDKVRKSWTFGPFQSDCIRLRFTTAAVSAAATPGAAWISYGVWAEPIEGMARTDATGQG